MKEQDLLVRVGVVADAAQLAAIQQQTWVATYPNAELGVTAEGIEQLGFTTPEAVARWEKILAQFTEERCVFVVECDGVVVGYCFVRRAETFGKIQALYVLPEHHGKGFGGALLRAAYAYIGANIPIVLLVADYNIRSIQFYEHQGFHMSGKTSVTPPELSPNGVRITQLEMCRQPKSTEGLPAEY